MEKLSCLAFLDLDVAWAEKDVNSIKIVYYPPAQHNHPVDIKLTSRKLNECDGCFCSESNQKTAQVNLLYYLVHVISILLLLTEKV